jgi:DNA helicase II / ATP-dependent DNA helicase PcrA
MDYQKVLTKAQFEAVTSCFGPMCILAGAGTGKTRVITHRIAWLIQEKGVYPENILGVTFTNKAAREMAQRVESLVPGAGRRVQLGTFHGTAAKLLRRYGYLIGVSPDFVIYDEEDALRLVKGLWERDTGAHVNADHRVAWRFFESWRQEAEGPPPHLLKSEDPFTVKCVRVFHAYEASLKQMSALDFSGLLVGWYRLLCHEGARQRLGSQVKHLLVDEYQDTNPIQAQIVYAHAENADSVSVVGDDDQSIYSWRGAVADNMKQFLKRLEGAQLIKLEENHRSTAQVLQAANSIITKNTQRLGKDLRAMKEDGPLLLLVRCNDDRAEAQKVTHLIQEQLMRGISPSEIAILVRTHADSRNFEESLTKAGIPYQLVGGTRFYARREIKDVLAMLRCAVNPQSDIDLLRAMTAIPRGIGQTTIKKMLIEAQKTNDILFHVMSDETRLTTAKISVGVRKKISRWVEKVTSLRTQTCALQTLKEQPLPLFSAPPPQPLNAKDAVTLAIELSGIGDHLLAQQDLEASNRLENLEELLSAAASYVEAAKSAETDSDESVLGFLADATLATEQAQKKSGDLQGERIHLMTLHASKGLEFDIVFLSALEEFGFPHARSLQEDADLSDLEEERRLAYVGITRAKKELVMTWAARRMVRGEIKRRQSSRFLSEIDPLVLRGDTHHIHRKRPQTHMSEQTFFDARPGDTSHRRKAIENVLQRRHSPERQDLSMRVELDPGYAGLASDGLQRGDRVRHTIFGNGKVLNVQGNGDLGRATILFERDGATRTIVLRYLEVLESAHSY